MKKTLYIFFLASILLCSCEKEPVFDETAYYEKTYDFSKDLVIKDEAGNVVDITLYSNNKSMIDYHNEKNFDLKVNSQDFEHYEDELSEETDQTEQLLSEDDQGDILIHIKPRSINSEVKQIAIVPKASISSQMRGRNWITVDYDFAYRFNDPKGVRVIYAKEYCANEYLKIKITKWRYAHSSNQIHFPVRNANLYELDDETYYFSTKHKRNYRVSTTVYNICETVYEYNNSVVEVYWFYH